MTKLPISGHFPTKINIALTLIAKFARLRRIDRHILHSTGHPYFCVKTRHTGSGIFYAVPNASYWGERRRGLKTILLHIHDDAGQESRLLAAIELASLCNGHIVCLQVAPIEPYSSDPYSGLFGLTELVYSLRDQDKKARLAIEARLRGENVSWSWKYHEDGAIGALVAEAQLADIVILSQPGHGRHFSDHPLAIIGDVVLNIRSPVLMVPTNADRRKDPVTPGFNTVGTAVLAWNGSAEAANAMRLTRTLLAKADCIHIVEVGNITSGLPSEAAMTYLSRHGIRCELHEWPAKGRSVCDALLNAVAELDANCLVIGAYGHSRLRETILGGATRDLIALAMIPLLMAH